MVFVKRSLQPVAKLVFEYHPIEAVFKAMLLFRKGAKTMEEKSVPRLIAASGSIRGVVSSVN